MEKKISLFLMLSIAFLASIGLNAYLLTRPQPATLGTRDNILGPRLPYTMNLDFDTARGFDNVIPDAQPFPELVTRRGGVGTMDLTLTHLDTRENLWLILGLYGIAPDFDNWILGAYENETLPDGITYRFDPSSVKLHPGENLSSTLTVAVGSNVREGMYKLAIVSHLTYTSGGPTSSSMGRLITLVVES